MKKIDGFIDKLLSAITVVLYMAMIIVVLLQILARYNPNLTLSWTEEFTRFLFVFIITLGAPLSLKYTAYADVDLLYDKFPTGIKKICYIIIYLAILVFSVVVVYSGYKFTLLGTRSLSPALRWPMYLHHSSILIFGVITTLYCVLKILKFLKSSDDAIQEYEKEEFE